MADENLQLILDDGIGYLALDGAFASDLAVTNAARVSFNKSSDVFSEKDRGLIGFLMENRHGTPFEHGYFRFICKVPLMVVREHHRHRVGHSYNEWSGRYSKIEPEFYIPTHVRTQVEGTRPGDYQYQEADTKVSDYFRTTLNNQCLSAYSRYEDALASGVAKEHARMLLPLNTYTKYYWSCNPRSLMHFLSLRTHPSAQWEIRQLAYAAQNAFSEYMPETYQAWVRAGRQAP